MSRFLNRFAFFSIVFVLAISGVAEAKNGKKHAKKKDAPKAKVVQNCFVEETAGKCSGGVLFKNEEGFTLCRVGRRIEHAYLSSRHICESGGHESTELPANIGKPCYFHPAENDALCSVGALDGENRGVCLADGAAVSRFFSDPKCQSEAAIKNCWVYQETKAGDPTTCDADHLGKIVVEDGLSRCKVDKRGASRDFFFDNHCDRGSLGWNGSKPFPVEKQSTLTRIKVLPGEGESKGEKAPSSAELKAKDAN